MLIYVGKGKLENLDSKVPDFLLSKYLPLSVPNLFKWGLKKKVSNKSTIKADNWMPMNHQPIGVGRVINNT